MVVLGINGWPNGGHDASACIVKDGEVIVIAEEERFIRKKHASNVYPHRSIQYCLRYTGLCLGNIDYVAFGWDLPFLYNTRGYCWKEISQSFGKELFPQSMFEYPMLPEIKFIPHHLSHAASAFWHSGFKQSSILIIDGQGEDCSTTLAFGDCEDGIKIISRINTAASLGYFYKAVSGYVGLGKENPGKTMGLASYGNNKDVYGNFDLVKLLPHTYKFQSFNETVEYDQKGSLDEMDQVVEWWYDYFKKSGIPQGEVAELWDFESNNPHYQHKNVMLHKDFAAWAQNALENISSHLVRELISTTGCRKLTMAGGVALNCSMNGKIASMKDVEDVFIYPVTNDAGAAVGAALELGLSFGIKPKVAPIRSIYLGPEYSDKNMELLLKKLKLSYEYFLNDDLFVTIANLIYSKNIVAVFRGRSEIGPRALGNRSILASPCSSVLRDSVNKAKMREEWRPLCPSVLQVYAHEYFIDAHKGSYFMLRFLKVNEKKKYLIPGVVHIDNTARVQLVEIETDFGRIINEFYKLSNIPMVLNTSFNLAGEPIVGSPLDAIRSFFSSSLDVLVLNNYIIRKS